MAEGVCQEGVCTPSSSACLEPPPAVCVDGVTLKQWRPGGVSEIVGSGCIFEFVLTTCETGCSDGACQTTPCQLFDLLTPCQTGDPCFPEGKCIQGVCVANGTGGLPGFPIPGGPSCPNAGPCTASLCDPALGECVTLAVDDGLPCDDNNACTSGTVCLGGQCTAPASEVA